MLLYLLGYLGLGLMAFIVTAIVIIANFAREGISVDAINDINDSILDEAESMGMNTAMRFVVGLLIWPVRLIQLIQCYETYKETCKEHEESN